MVLQLVIRRIYGYSGCRTYGYETCPKPLVTGMNRSIVFSTNTDRQRMFYEVIKPFKAKNLKGSTKYSYVSKYNDLRRLKKQASS